MGQVDPRGQHVDLMGIENALVAHPLVDQAAVAVLGDASESLLAGYAVQAANGALTGEELRRHAVAILPAELIPDLFVVVDRLPVVAPGGEVDQAALARAARGGDRGDGGGGHTGGDGAPPAILGGAAAQIADIWRKVLRADAVALTDDLFELGGHSLAITRITTRIRSNIGVDVPLEVFYDTPTLAAVAAAVERLGDGGSGPA